MSDEPLYCPGCGEEYCKGAPCPGWDSVGRDPSLAKFCELCGVPEPCPHCAEQHSRARRTQ
jgi:hypothetical protein